MGEDRAYSPSDVSVIIPTRDRWPTLQRTVDALRAQDCTGFEIVVVADGHDQDPPPLRDVTVVVKEHAGPGSARNAGVARSGGSLVLLLGDDTEPEPGLVSAHVAAHVAHAGRPGPVAVLGRIDWHPEVAALPVNRWIERSGSQFDYASLEASGSTEAGWARFYASNVSLPRSAFDAVDGFDDDFYFLYEDLDLGWRLDQAGVPVFYEPRARCLHRHPYDVPRLRQRMRAVARSERRFAAKHPWFTPFFLERARMASARRPVARAWARLERHVPAAVPFGSAVRARADRWYEQQVATPVLEGWEAGGDELELEAYLGPSFDRARLVDSGRLLMAELEAAGDETAFYRTSEAYLYDLTAFATWGVKDAYLREIQDLVPPGSRLLDYGCGIGSDGLRLIDRGYDVSFADFDNPSTRYLRWRLDRRGSHADIYDVESDIPGPFDLVYSFDVIEHVPDPFAFLDRLESLAPVVVVNFLAGEDDHGDRPHGDHAHPHHELPVDALLDAVAARDLIRYRRYHGRSHLVAYRTHPSRGAAALRSRVERRLGPRLPRADHALVPSRRAAAVRTLERTL